ncbi:MAG: Hpt domain-containing protein [Alphaproteobacteria bacterium]|nr:Hpt domain-containing protein [Alphaproteobacteria bacterium]
MGGPADDEILDLGHLRQFTGGDPSTEREVFELFVLGAQGYYVALTASLPGSIEWRRAAHALKGSARAIGAREVGRLVEELEAMPAGGDRVGVLRELARLDQAIARARARIRALHPGT